MNKNKPKSNRGGNNLAELRKSVLVASAGASTRLAGAKLSDKEIEKFLKK